MSRASWNQVSSDADALSSIPPRRPVGLIHLVETETPEASRAFVARVTQGAEAAGGRVVLANEAIAAMIVPDESTGRSDHAIRLLVVTQYPTRQAADRPRRAAGIGPRILQ